MDAKGDKEPPVSELVKQLVEDGKAYARAELDVARARASDEARRVAARYRTPALLFALSLGFFTASITVFCVLLAIEIAQITGPLLGGVFGALIALMIAGTLFFFARKGLEEKE